MQGAESLGILETLGAEPLGMLETSGGGATGGGGDAGAEPLGMLETPGAEPLGLVEMQGAEPLGMLEMQGAGSLRMLEMQGAEPGANQQRGQEAAMPRDAYPRTHTQPYIITINSQILRALKNNWLVVGVFQSGTGYREHLEKAWWADRSVGHLSILFNMNVALHSMANTNLMPSTNCRVEWSLCLDCLHYL